jgi:hypothetical protein
LTLLLAGAAVAAACSDDGQDNPNGSGGAAGSPDYCAGSLDRLIGCGQPPTDEDLFLSNCEEMLSCWELLFVPEYTDAVFSCANARPCDTPTAEGCGADVVEQHRNDPSNGPAYDECMARYEECCADGSCDFNEGRCSAILVENEPVRSGDLACLSSACDAIFDCLIDSAQQLGVKPGCAPS